MYETPEKFTPEARPRRVGPKRRGLARESGSRFVDMGDQWTFQCQIQNPHTLRASWRNVDRRNGTRSSLTGCSRPCFESTAGMIRVRVSLCPLYGLCPHTTARRNCQPLRRGEGGRRPTRRAAPTVKKVIPRPLTIGRGSKRALTHRAGKSNRLM